MQSIVGIWNSFPRFLQATLSGCLFALSVFFGQRLLVADEGLVRGTIRCVKTECPDFIKIAESQFILASDGRTCLTGTSNAGSKNESYLLANLGNDVVVSAEISRNDGEILTVDGNWIVSFFVEQDHMKLDNTFESRYRIANTAGFMNISLPIFLSWEVQGVSRDVMLNALAGENYQGKNELGILEISGSGGIEKIRVVKEALDLFGPGPRGKSLAEMKIRPFPEGLKSITQEFTFDPKRRKGIFEPFTCKGTIVYTVPNGNSYQV